MILMSYELDICRNFNVDKTSHGKIQMLTKNKGGGGGFVVVCKRRKQSQVGTKKQS